MVLQGYNRALEMIASGAALEEVLYGIAATVESARPDTLCSIVMLDASKTRLRSIAAPSIAPEFMQAIDGVAIGPQEGSCGAAMFRREPVIVADILAHPYWEKYREDALKADLRACWSEPILDANGEILGALAMYYREVRAPGRDDLNFIHSVAHLAGIAITNSLVQQRLQESFNSIKRAKQEWESTVDSLDNLIALLDQRQHVLRANRAIQNWGSDVRQIKGKPIQNLFPSENFQTSLGRAWSRLEHGETSTFEFHDPQSSVYWLAQLHPISTATYRDHFGTESHAVIVITDVTQQKRLEQAQMESHQVRLKLQMDQQVVGMRQSFVSAVSHEFRTPLAVIKSSRDILERYHEQLTPERRQVHFERIDEQINLMVEMVDQVLFISQTAENRISVRMENIRLQDFCRNMLGDMDQMTHQSHKLELYPAQKDIILCTDARLLRQIMGNLISNAIKYSPVGSVVRVMLSQEGTDCTIMVTDQGIGIPLADQERLFDPFYRASNVNEIKGTGLGMTVVKNAVDVLHGEISFTSQPGEGSTFIVRLPLGHIPA
jgi:PAS domain S-box-containing protein